MIKDVSKQTCRSMDRIEEPDLKPRSSRHLTFYKDANNTHYRRDSLFNTRCQGNWVSKYRRIKLNSCLSPYIKPNSTWIQDLNIRPRTLKLLEEKVQILQDVGIIKDLLNRTPVIQEMNSAADK